MVVAPQPEAVEAGLETLKSGGNVIDAAISAAFVQTAVDPQMCGIAGFGSMQIYMPNLGGHTAIDFHGRAPFAATEGMWEHLIEKECEDGFGYVLKGRLNEFGYKSLTTPLTLKDLHLAQQKFGKKLNLFFNTVGFAYDDQKQNKLPVEKFDYKLDFVLTEKQLYTFL